MGLEVDDGDGISGKPCSRTHFELREGAARGGFREGLKVAEGGG